MTKEKIISFAQLKTWQSFNQFSADNERDKTFIMPVFSKVNQDLKEERDKVTFNIEEFTNWYHGGPEKVKEKRFFGEKVEFILKFVQIFSFFVFRGNFSERS